MEREIWPSEKPGFPDEGFRRAFKNVWFCSCTILRFTENAKRVVCTCRPIPWMRALRVTCAIWSRTYIPRFANACRQHCGRDGEACYTSHSICEGAARRAQGKPERHRAETQALTAMCSSQPHLICRACHDFCRGIRPTISRHPPFAGIMLFPFEE